MKHPAQVHWQILGAIAVLLLAPGGWVLGSVEFEHSILQVPADISAEKIGGAFAFTNKGDSAVTITEVKTSCGCTTATLEKKRYDPGESGKIEAFLTVGQRVGRQSKAIQVYTDDPDNPVYTLTLNTDIPKIMDIRPRLLYWEKGAAPDPKSITVIIVYPGPVRIEELHTSNPAFRASVKAIEEGRKYVVTVVPESTDTSQRGAVYFHTDLEPDPARQFFTYLRVQ